MNRQRSMFIIYLLVYKKIYKITIVVEINIKNIILYLNYLMYTCYNLANVILLKKSNAF